MTVNTRRFLPGGIAVCGGVAEQEPEFLEPGVEGVPRGHGGSYTDSPSARSQGPGSSQRECVEASIERISLPSPSFCCFVFDV